MFENLRKEIYYPGLKFKYTIDENAIVYNETKGTVIKPSIDKRRPNQPSAIYLKKDDGGRVYTYLENLVAERFCKGYQSGDYIHHKDNDIRNCAASNLETYDITEYINHFMDIDVTRWKRVNIGKPLLYEYYISDNGVLFNGSTYSIVQPFKDNRSMNNDYLRFTLYLSDGDSIHYSASRMVAIHFIGKPFLDKKDNVYFKDGNTQNLNYTNLAWGDRYDVINNAFRLNPDRKPIKLYCYQETEEWKPLDFIDNLAYDYEVSSFGRVYNKTLDNMLTNTADRKAQRTQKYRSSGNLNNQSWCSVSLVTKDGTMTRIPIHVLVATAFVENPDPEHYNVVNHINGNPEYNCAWNLEWCSTLKNMYHAINTNLQHSSAFIGYVTDTYWRSRTILAWLCSMYDMTIPDECEKIYSIYQNYSTTYPDSIEPIETYDRFCNIIKKYFSSDHDFQKLYAFYTSEYGQAYSVGKYY